MKKPKHAWAKFSRPNGPHRITDRAVNKEKILVRWAHTNYIPGTLIDPTWDPIVKEECRKINTLAATKGQFLIMNN